MLKTLNKICREIKNWFETPTRRLDSYVVSNGRISDLDFVQDGQYYRIIGSLFNDGVHHKGDDADILQDEVFRGVVVGLSVPQEVVGLAAEVKAYLDDDANAPTAITSESVGGHSIGRATKDGIPILWQDVFSKSLLPWRKI